MPGRHGGIRHVPREQLFAELGNESSFDVTILGGGINGAGFYLTLCRRGYRVALLDNGDLASGTSRASGMMIWGRAPGSGVSGSAWSFGYARTVTA